MLHIVILKVSGWFTIEQLRTVLKEDHWDVLREAADSDLALR